jgi:predicted HTH domain antitoxin
MPIATRIVIDRWPWFKFNVCPELPDHQRPLNCLKNDAGHNRKVTMVTPQELVHAGLYSDEHSVIEEALRVLWQERPQLRLVWAMHQYQTQAISLAKAAAVAGVSFDRMKELLVKRGIQPLLGPESIEEARQELEVVDITWTPRNL